MTPRTHSISCRCFAQYLEAVKPAVIADGRLTLDGLKGVEEVYRANGIVKTPVPWDRLVTNEFLPQ